MEDTHIVLGAGMPQLRNAIAIHSEPHAEARLETPAERRRRRAEFLRELTEARELRARVQPRRTKAARLRQAMFMRTFRV